MMKYLFTPIIGVIPQNYFYIATAAHKNIDISYAVVILSTRLRGVMKRECEDYD
jgi:hypothetical protein